MLQTLGNAVRAASSATLCDPIFLDCSLQVLSALNVSKTLRKMRTLRAESSGWGCPSEASPTFFRIGSVKATKLPFQSFAISRRTLGSLTVTSTLSRLENFLFFSPFDFMFFCTVWLPRDNGKAKAWNFRVVFFLFLGMNNISRICSGTVKVVDLKYCSVYLESMGHLHTFHTQTNSNGFLLNNSNYWLNKRNHLW